MAIPMRRLSVGIMILVAVFSLDSLFMTRESLSEESEFEEPGMEILSVSADPELEEQIEEIQDALTFLHKDIARHKEALHKTEYTATQTTLQAQLDSLLEERDTLESLLYQLVDEAKASEWTAVDKVLRRAEREERQQERLERREEIIQDRADE